MFSLFLWAVLIGGMPTSGYYLYQYGKKLYERSRQQRARYTEPEEAAAQHQAELLFSGWMVAWACFGLALCQVLKAVDNLH